MRIDYTYREALTAEEVALIAVGLDEYYDEIPGQYIIDASVYVDDNEMTRSDMSLVVEKVREALSIKHNLLDKIARINKKSHNYFDSGQPSVIELSEEMGSPLDPDPEKATMTKKSVAKWFCQHYQPDKAKLFDPECNDFSSEIDNSDNRTGNLAREELTIIAEIVSEECLKGLPHNMSEPNRKQLVSHIKAKGINKIKDINVVITLIMPEGHKFKGGKGDPEKLPWLPKDERD